MRVDQKLSSLLFNVEVYVEDSFEKSLKIGKRAYGGLIFLEEMAEVLRSAGYMVVSSPGG